MENKAIIQFDKVAINPNEFEQLSEKRQAVFILFGHAYNELNLALRHAVTTRGLCEHKDEKHINDLASSITFHAYRHLAAKLFEFHELISKSGVTNKIISDAIENFKELRRHPGYKHAEILRHKNTYHYDLNHIRKMLRRNTKFSDFYFLNADQDGNTFFPTTEMFLFSGALETRLGCELSDAELKERLDELFDWMLQTKRWASDLMMKFISQEVCRPLKVRPRRVVHYVPMNYVANLGDSPPPLYTFTR